MFTKNRLLLNGLITFLNKNHEKILSSTLLQIFILKREKNVGQMLIIGDFLT